MSPKSLHAVVALAILVISIADVTAAVKPATKLSSAVATLYSSVVASQWQDDKNYTFPFDWGHVKGRFPNDIHLNFVGGPLMQQLRNAISFPDDNGFVDLFVLEAMYSAGTMFPEAAPLNDTAFALALSTAIDNHDRYSPPDTPLFGFWPQRLVKVVPGLGPKWEQWSLNLSQAATDGTIVDGLLKLIMDAIGLGALYDLLIAPFQATLSQMLKTFSIPMDSDDTGCTIALTRLLTPAALPTSTAIWAAQKFNESRAFEKMAKYSYCPASNDFIRNSIDPRTYFWAQDYLRTVTDPGECIVTTWMTNYDEELDVYHNRSVKPMAPFNVNNLDATVAANAIFGMTATLLRPAADKAWHSDAAIRSLYLSTARFVAWTLQGQVNRSRPDLQDLYYPCIVNLPMFVARHVVFLESYLRNNGGVFPAPFAATLTAVHTLLRTSLHSGGMEYLMTTMVRDDAANTNGTYWNGFLGMGDTDDQGNPTPHPLDRMYTTAVALNAIIDAWTFEVPAARGNGSVALKWLESTPSTVSSIVSSTTNFILRSVANSSTSWENVFFSGSIHAMNTFPWDFPFTSVIEMINGTRYNCANFTGYSAVTTHTFWAMNGNSLSPSEYAAMAASGCGGINATKSFVGFNEPESPWPYWSSPPLTKAIAMAALSKVHALGMDI